MTPATDILRRPFAMHRTSFEAAVQAWQAWEATPRQVAALTRREDDPPAPSYAIAGDTALIEVSGPILKSVPQCMRLFGFEATSTEEVAEQIRAAAKDPRVVRIALELDTPGGTVSGVQELADLIKAVDAAMPVHAIVRDLCASAGYWIAAQCRTISANATAEIGSIGVYMAVHDESRAMENEGVKTYVVSSGGTKGAGVEGAPITPDHLAVWQDGIDAIASLFVSAVASGRGLSAEDAQALATGRTWIASEAQRLGLIDYTENYDAALRRITNT